MTEAVILVTLGLVLSSSHLQAAPVMYEITRASPAQNGGPRAISEENSRNPYAENTNIALEGPIAVKSTKDEYSMHTSTKVEPNNQKTLGPKSAAVSPRTFVRGPTATDVGPNIFAYLKHFMDENNEIKRTVQNHVNENMRDGEQTRVEHATDRDTDDVRPTDKPAMDATGPRADANSDRRQPADRLLTGSARDERHKGAPNVQFKLDYFGNVYYTGDSSADGDSMGGDIPTKETLEPCGDGRCLCNTSHALCIGTRNGTKLSYIPRFSDSVTYLDFRKNYIKSIPSPAFFLNVSNITYLDLGANGLTKIKDGDLSLLTRLKVLKIDHNIFKHSDNFTGALLETLELLQVIHVGLKHGLSVDVFSKYPMPNLIHLYLHDNNMTAVDMQTFSPLERLEDLGIADNEISRFKVGHLKAVNRMIIEANFLREFPDTCIGNTNESAYPSLTWLNLKFNLIRGMSRVCLPKLQFLRLKGNAFCSFPKDMFSSKWFPALSSLELESQRVTESKCSKNISDFAFSNPALQSLTLMYNNIDFDNVTCVGNHSFANATGIVYLDLGHNYLTRTERLMQLFGHMTELQFLELGHTGFQDLDDSIAHFSHLQSISLYHNMLKTIPDGVFDSLTNLTVLDLSNNLLTTVRETTFGADTLRRLKRLDLGRSIGGYDCSCDLVWFSSFLRSRPDLVNSSFPYRCGNIPSENVSTFHINPQQCLLGAFASSLCSVTSAIMIVALTSFTVFYRYRWHIRLVLYDAFRGHNASARWRRLQQRHFRYDLFVSYASEDLSWVTTYLVPELEEKLKLRLCLHERNFIPGVPIVDNISESVEDSKKILMLFSTHFARSQWCQFELAYCLSHVLDVDDTLVVACLHHIPSRDLTSAMMAMFKTTTYIQWEKGEDAKMSFWGRLRIALHEILPLSARIP